MSRLRWRRCWTTARSAAPVGAALACDHGVWPATRWDTAALPPGARLHRRPVIPSESKCRQLRVDREAYRQRNRIERLINRLKQFRRIATRYEKRGTNYLAMVMLGMILLWL